jgi:hypothetical protein
MLNQRLVLEGWISDTGSILCQTITWVEGAREEERCTGLQLVQAKYSADNDTYLELRMELAFKKRGKNGISIQGYKSIFKTYDSIEIYDVDGKEIGPSGVARVTGTLINSSDDKPTLVVEIIEAIEEPTE